MKWMDVVMGEVEAKRDDEEAREARRREVAEATRTGFDNLVRPALQALSRRLKAAGRNPRLVESEADERSGQRLRLIADDAVADAFVEFAAESFHRLIVVWLKRHRDDHVRRFAVLCLDDLDGARVDECAQALERELS